MMVRTLLHSLDLASIAGWLLGVEGGFGVFVGKEKSNSYDLGHLINLGESGRLHLRSDSLLGGVCVGSLSRIWLFLYPPLSCLRHAQIRLTLR